MRSSQGFIGVGILVAILLGLIIIGGSTYYVTHQNLYQSTEALPATSTSIQNAPSSNTTGQSFVSTHRSQLSSFDFVWDIATTTTSISGYTTYVIAVEYQGKKYPVESFTGSCKPNNTITGPWTPPPLLSNEISELTCNFYASQIALGIFQANNGSIDVEESPAGALEWPKQAGRLRAFHHVVTLSGPTNSNVVPLVTLDQNSLTSSSATPTLSGSAVNASSVDVQLADSFGGWEVYFVPVVDGHWSVTSPYANFAPGTTTVYAFVSGSGVPSAESTLTITARIEPSPTCKLTIVSPDGPTVSFSNDIDMKPGLAWGDVFAVKGQPPRTTVQVGHSFTATWESTNATNAFVGPNKNESQLVDTNGSTTTIYSTGMTSYSMFFDGPGGTTFCTIYFSF